MVTLVKCWRIGMDSFEREKLQWVTVSEGSPLPWVFLLGSFLKGIWDMFF